MLAKHYPEAHTTPNADIQLKLAYDFVSRPAFAETLPYLAAPTKRTRAARPRRLSRDEVELQAEELLEKQCPVRSAEPVLHEF